MCFPFLELRNRCSLKSRKYIQYSSAFQRQHRTIRQESVVRDFSSAERLENRGILGVFPIFQTARMGEKTRHPAADAIVRCCLRIFVVIRSKRNRCKKGDRYLKNGSDPCDRLLSQNRSRERGTGTAGIRCPRGSRESAP